MTVALHRRRCVRPDEVSAQVRCHYLTDGTVNFAFTIRRSEYFIPAGVLLKCFLETTDREIYTRLVSSAPKVLSLQTSGFSQFKLGRDWLRRCTKGFTRLDI